jgi:hypothetical protein
MRLAHVLSPLMGAASLAAAFCTFAAPAAWALPPLATPPFADPAAATPALPHHPLHASGGLEAAPTDWRSANAAVGAFPQSHADLLRWEAAQASATPPTSDARPTSAPHAAPAASAHEGHHHHSHHPAPAMQPGGQP